MTRVTTTWYYSHASAWLCSPFSTTTPTRETPGGQAGVESLLCLRCAAWGQPQGGRLHCRSPPLTTCLSWLLQMGGGACQAHEPADRGGHAAGGKSPQRSRPGEAQGEPRGPGARSSGAKLGAVPSIAPTLCYLLQSQSLLHGAKRLFYTPRFGAGKGPAQKIVGVGVGKPRPKPWCCPGFRGDLEEVTPLSCLLSPI